MTKQITNMAQFKPLPKSRGKIGVYFWSDTTKIDYDIVQSSSVSGTNFPLSIDIFAQPCTVVPDSFKCGGAGGSTIDAGQVDLQNLAVGDEFTTSDYTVVVTDMESGSPAAGWKGKGKLIFNFLKLTNNLAIQIPISVKFDGIKINQCYQLYSDTVITEYDPSWSSVADVGMVLDRLNSLLTEIKDLLANATENAALLRQKVTELRNARADINTGDFTQEYKTEQLAAYGRAITGMVCLVGDPDIPAGSRISANYTTQSCDVSTVSADLDNLDNKAENSIVNPYYGDVFDEGGNFLGSTQSVDPKKNYIIIKLDNFHPNFGLFLKISEYDFTNINKYEMLSDICVRYYSIDLELNLSFLYNRQFSFRELGTNNGYNIPDDIKDNAQQNMPNSGEFVTEIPHKMIYRVNGSKLGRGAFYSIPNLRSSIYHEYQHLTGLYTNNDETAQGAINHLETYYRQFRQYDFIYMTDEYKSLIINNVKNLLNKNILSNNIKQLWKNKFKSIGYEF